MTGRDQEEPNLIFFRERPKDLLNHPPLASSLQHLETSFLLVALGRYPHALVSCASAIESALQAGFKTGQNSRWGFKRLLEEARKKFQSSANVDPSAIKEFREKRNEIIHYGFSPKDDEISAILLLKTGYRLIEQSYKTFFDFQLKDNSQKDGGLLPDLARQLDISRKVYFKVKDEVGLNLTYCFIAFAHAIRWGVRHWMLSDLEQDLLRSAEESGWEPWEFKQKEKERLDRNVFNGSWEFDCPICGGFETFVCELNVDGLEKGKIRLGRGFCVECSLSIPKNCPFLSDELCGDQFDEERPKILKEYGIK